MRIAYLSRRKKAAATLRQCAKALRRRLTDSPRVVKPGQAQAIAAREVRALGLVLDGPAAVYTRMFQCSIEDACQVGPGGAFLDPGAAPASRLRPPARGGRQR